MPFLLFAATAVVTFTGFKLYQDVEVDSKFDQSAIEKVNSEDSSSNEVGIAQNNLTIASLSLFLASIGSAFYLPFLLFASGIGIIYTTVSIWQTSYYSIVKARQVNWSVVESIAFPWLLSTGYYFSTALLNWFSWLVKTFISEFKVLGKDLRRSFFKAFGKLPTKVWLEKNGIELEISVNTLKVGDVVVVNAGEIVPVDGIVVEGNGYVNQYLLTGKHQPLAKKVNDQIFASNTIIAGRLLIKAERWGADTVVAEDMSVYHFKHKSYEAS